MTRAFNKKTSNLFTSQLIQLSTCSKGVKERRTSRLVAVAKHGGRVFVSKKACVYMLPVHTHTAEAARVTRLSQQQLGEILPQSVCGRRYR